MNRRNALQLVLGSLACSLVAPARAATDLLPLDQTFVGQKSFAALCKQAIKDKWADLPIGQRVATIASGFRGLPYRAWTLEIDDKVECPSVNLTGLDCWTLFEVALCFARMLENGEADWSPVDLLAEIEWTRYRGGVCGGSYIERIHYLTEWFADNEARGNVTDVTRSLKGAARLTGRRNDEMTSHWKSYRYLKANSSLVMKLVAAEKAVDSLPTFYVPNDMVAKNYGKLQNGDIVGIVTNRQGTVCSHVGVIVHASDGLPYLLHASSNFKKVVLEAPLADYLSTYKAHIGIIVSRPLAVSKTVRDAAKYKANLSKIRARE